MKTILRTEEKDINTQDSKLYGYSIHRREGTLAG